MRLPSISPDNKSRDFIDVFGGYNHNPRINDNEFYDMKNLSSDSYPLLAVRSARGGIPSDLQNNDHQITGKGFLYRNGLYYITTEPSQDKYIVSLYGPVGNSVCQISSWTSDTDEIRKLIPMGGKLIIMPDKICVNVAGIDNQNALPVPAEPLENTNEATGTVSIQPCLEDGSVLTIDYVGDSTPVDPPDGYVWLDTNYSPAALKKYYAASGMWQSFISSYIKITDSEENISEGFSTGDGVKISGIQNSDLSDLNAVAIIKKIPNNKSLVLSGLMDPMEDKSILTVDYTINNRTRVSFYCDRDLQAANLVGKKIKIADHSDVVCNSVYADTAPVPPIAEIGGDDLAVSSQTLVTKNTVTDSSVFDIDITNWNGFNGDISGRSVVFGNLENNIIVNIVAATTRMDPLSHAVQPYIVIDTVLSMPTGTVISPVVFYRHANLYGVTLDFESAVSAKQGDKACPSLETQYTQNCTQLADRIYFLRRMPVMDFVTESQNRLWGCRYGSDINGEFVNEIYCSKLGDPKNWEVYEGISTDSYRASVGSEGEWTGAVNYRGYPVFFKEHHIHTVLGSYPPYQINDNAARGIQKGCSDSLAMVNEVLYYKAIHGICAYSGGLPADISSVLGNIQYKDAIACAFKDKYYICMKDSSDSPVLFVYDTVRGLWHKEDDFYAVQFAVADDDVYFIKDSGGEYLSGSLLGSGGVDTDPVEWYAETGLYGLSTIDSKYISRINLRLMLPVGAYMFVSIMYDSSGDWEQVGHIIGQSLMPFTLPIKPRRCDHFRMRLEGVGEMKLYSISKTIEQGNDKCLI